MADMNDTYPEWIPFASKIGYGRTFLLGRCKVNGVVYLYDAEADSLYRHDRVPPSAPPEVWHNRRVAYSHGLLGRSKTWTGRRKEAETGEPVWLRRVPAV